MIYSGLHLVPCIPCMSVCGIVFMAEVAVLYKSLLRIEMK